MEEIFTDDPDGEVDWRPSELELAVTGDIRWSALAQAVMPGLGSALAQAAMPRLPGAADILRLGGVDAGVVMNEVVRATGIHDILSATAKDLLEESGFMRRFQEEIIAPLGSAATSAIFNDLRLTTGNVIKVNEMFGLSGDRAFDLADAAFRMSDDRAFGLAARLSRERDSLLAMDGLPDARLTGLSAIIPPVGFLLTDNARRAQTVEPPSRLFTEPFQPWWPPVPTPDHLLIGNRYYRADYPISPVDDAAGALPDDAVLIHELRVSGGSMAQIGNLFEHFFGPARSPERYFVVRDRLERRWTIYHAKGTGRDARERATVTNGVAGYIVCVDLPVAIVEVYGVVESNRPLFGSFIERLQEEIKSTGFKLGIAGQKIKREPPVGVLERVKAVCKLREERKRKGVVLITRTAACQLKGIDGRTFRKYEPEIYERWEDSEI